MRLGVLLLFACSLAAQSPQFDARSRLVLIPVTVRDAKGRDVAGLEAADFRLMDNGRPQSVTVDTIDTGVAPIALIVAVQSSGISAAAVEKARRIGAMIQPLVTGERGCAGVVAFDEKVDWLQECTDDSSSIDRAFRKLEAVLRPGEDRNGHMLDAVDSAVEHLKRLADSRRVLLLISESRDRGSETTLQAAAVAAQTAGVTVYAATYSAFKETFTAKGPVAERPRALKPKTPMDVMGTDDGGAPKKEQVRIVRPEDQVDVLASIGELIRLNKENAAAVLSQGTGGAIFPFTKQKALEEAIEKMGAELHAQYILSFAPEVRTAGYHTLGVKVVRAGDFEVRARPGYWGAE